MRRHRYVRILLPIFSFFYIMYIFSAKNPYGNVKVITSIWRRPVDEPLPRVNGTIPPMVHQLWNDEYVPLPVITYMRSWPERHPNWEYWFWTKKSQLQFVREKHPSYLFLYVGYKYDIQRSDMIRFLILYEFGGIYVDLDMEVIKPLDDMISGKSCLLSATAEEITSVFFTRNETFIMNNAVIACRPKHPLLKSVLTAFNRTKHLDDIMASTGPLLLTSAVKNYLKDITGSNEVVPTGRSFDIIHARGKLPTNDVHIVNSDYFLPTFAPIHVQILREKCTKLLYSEPTGKLGNQTWLYYRRMQLCKLLEMVNYTRYPTDKAYTMHHWMGSWVPKTGWVDKHRSKSSEKSNHANIVEILGLQNLSIIQQRLSK